MAEAPQPRANAFPKSARLLRRPEFLAVRKSGQGFAEGPLAVSWSARPAGSGPTRPAPVTMEAAVARVGLAVSTKVGGSVVRNRVKRRLREAIRHELSLLPAVDLVIVARPGLAEVLAEERLEWLEGELRELAARASRSPA